VFDSAHPYAGGQHRGIDIGGDEGAPVRAPIDGVVSFAGAVPTGGKTVSIETPLGYTATLLHLGTISVKRGASVVEGATVIGTVGAADDAQPYLYFGVRVTSEPQGYVDPLTLLPPRPSPEPAPAPEVSIAPQVTAAASSEPAAPTSEQPPEPAAPVSEESPASPSEQSAAADEPAAPAKPAPVAASGSSSSQPVTDASSVATEAPAPPATTLVPRPVPGAETPPVTAGSESIASGSGVPLVAPAEPPAPLPSLGLLRVEAPPASVSLPEAVLDPAVVPTLVRSADPVAARSVARSRVRDRGRRMPSQHGTAPAIASSRRVGSTSVLRDAVIGALCGVICGAFALLLHRRRNAVRAKPARIMSVPVGCTVEEDSRRARVAVRERSAPPRTRGELRGSGGHLRALPPAEGRRRPDGEWDGRARNAGDGLSRQRRRLAA
jgi:Peptidase family M23